MLRPFLSTDGQRGKKAKHVLRRSCLERFDDSEIRKTHHNALQAEVRGFMDSILVRRWKVA